MQPQPLASFHEVATRRGADLGRGLVERAGGVPRLSSGACLLWLAGDQAKAVGRCVRGRGNGER